MRETTTAAASSWTKVVSRSAMWLGFVFMSACTPSVNATPARSVIVVAHGESPHLVARAVAKNDRGTLRIVVKSGDVTQTRVYNVEANGANLALNSTGVTTERPDNAPIHSAVASLRLTIGRYGEIVAPGQPPRSEIPSSASLAEDNARALPDDETVNELRWLFVPLPDEPIGPGAHWRFEQDYYSPYGPVHQSAEYELVRRDHNHLEVHVDVISKTKVAGAVRASGTVLVPVGTAWRTPRATLTFSNPQASGTIDMAPLD